MDLLSRISQPKGTSDLPFTFPPFYLTEEEAVWTCETCGEIRPAYRNSIKRWCKQECPCQKEAKRREEEAVERKKRQEIMVKMTYKWLGHNWSDIEMAMKTFENFDRSRQAEGFDAASLFTETLEGTLVLHGVFGTGKTHLLAAVCNRLRACGAGYRGP